MKKSKVLKGIYESAIQKMDEVIDRCGVVGCDPEELPAVVEQFDKLSKEDRMKMLSRYKNLIKSIVII